MLPRSATTGRKKMPMAKIALKRTSLYAGGTSPAKLLQARFYNEDCLVYDLEDSVPIAEKDVARHLVYNLIKYQRPEGKYVIIRVNGIYSEFIDEDLEAAVRARPDHKSTKSRRALALIPHISALFCNAGREQTGKILGL